MKPPKINLDKIRKEYRAINPIGLAEQALDLLLQSYTIFSITHENLTKELSKEEREKLDVLARHNCIVNIVTAFEIFFKSQVLHKNDWSKEGYEKLLSEEIKLSTAYEMLQGEKITREYIIAHSQSFQNFHNINRVFSSLIDRGFYNDIELVKVSGLISGNATFLEEFPNWREKIISIFEIRHRFIHHGEMNLLSTDDIDSLFNLALVWVTTIDAYFSKRDNDVYSRILIGVIVNAFAKAFGQHNQQRSLKGEADS